MIDLNWLDYAHLYLFICLFIYQMSTVQCVLKKMKLLVRGVQLSV